MNETIELTVKITIPDQQAQDVLTTAVEGGMNYWANYVSIKRAEDLTVTEILLLEEGDGDASDDVLKVNADVIRLGVRNLHYLIEKGEVHLGSEIGSQFMHHLFSTEEGLEYVDAVCADAIVQAGLFEEVRYG